MDEVPSRSVLILDEDQANLRGGLVVVKDYVFNLVLAHLVNVLFVLVHQFSKGMLGLIEVSGDDAALLLEA